MPPLSFDRCLASAADHAACRAMLAGGSRTFLMASHLLPWRVRDPAIALYAFCRQADDAVDGGGGRTAIDGLKARLDAIYERRPMDGPADRAFADAVVQFSIPKPLPLALLEGFLWDVEGRVYDKCADVEAYAARVAGTVGAMMALLMGVTDATTLARACDLGVAMQLTNIARDVGEDARMGRIYLPLDWLAECGIDRAQFLAAPRRSEAVAMVVRRLLQRAETFYASADAGIEALPTACRPAIRAARRLYAEIGRDVEANGCDSVSRRAFVPARRKIVLAARAFSAASPTACAPVLEGAEFLLDAALRVASSGGDADAWRIDDRLVWAAHLLERQGRRSASKRATAFG